MMDEQPKQFITDDQLKQLIKDIKTYLKRAEGYSDAPGAIQIKIDLLTKAHTLMGRVSARMDGDHKRLKAQIDHTYNFVRDQAPKGRKEADANRAVAELVKMEPDAYELKQYWRNEFASVREEIFALRLKAKQDMQLGVNADG